MSVASEVSAEESFMSAAKSAAFSRHDLAAIVVTAAVWTVLALVIDASGDFPLLDDWAYGLPVRAFLDRGEIRLTDWTSPLLLAQGIWGGLFCLPNGFSFATLRVSTIVAGLIGLVGMYGLLRELGATRWVALLATWTLGANPVYVSLSYTFMTDIPFLCLMILSSFLLIRGMARDTDRAIWLGLLTAFLSVFIRQIGVAIFLGFACAYPFWRGMGRRFLVQAILPVVLAFVALKACERGLNALDRLPLAYYKSNDSTAKYLGLLARGNLGVFKHTIPKVWEVLLFLGLYTAPFSLLCWPSRLACMSRRKRLAEVGVILGLTVVGTAAIRAAGGEVLRQYNMVYDFGVGPRLGGDQLAAGWPRRMPMAPCVILTAFTVLGMILAIRALGDACFRTLLSPRGSALEAQRAPLVFLVAASTIYCGPICLSFLLLYDRYILGVLPLALALIWTGHGAATSALGGARVRHRPLGVALGSICLLLSLTFAVAGTHDYLDSSRVRWNTDLKLAEELSVPATDIDGGWEYNNYLANRERIYKSRHERDLEMSAVERAGGLWGASLDRPYRVSSNLAEGYEIISKVPLSPWLPLAPAEFIVSRRTGPGSAAR